MLQVQFWKSNSEKTSNALTLSHWQCDHCIVLSLGQADCVWSHIRASVSRFWLGLGPRKWDASVHWGGGRLKMRNMKMRHKNAAVENASNAECEAESTEMTQRRWHIPPLQFRAAFSCPAFSAPSSLELIKTCSYYHRSFLVDRQNLIKLDVVVPDSYLDRTLRLQWVRGHVRRELAYITYLSTSMLTINPFIERSLILSYRYTLSN